MIFTIEQARDILRIDGSDNDVIILPLLAAIPPYLEATTGYSPRTDAGGEAVFSPIAKTAGQFLLQLWYYGENADTDKLQRVLDCLLKALSAERGQP
ncbi:MAG: head-tail connector protein [Succiniclasticum sp.]|nr:head-tail connector protein [Succiniclasticum sp.]